MEENTQISLIVWWKFCLVQLCCMSDVNTLIVILSWLFFFFGFANWCFVKLSEVCWIFSSRKWTRRLLSYCKLRRNKKLRMRVNVMFRDFKKKNFSSFLTDRKLKEISPKATDFCFGTKNPVKASWSLWRVAAAYWFVISCWDEEVIFEGKVSGKVGRNQGNLLWNHAAGWPTSNSTQGS